MDTTGWANYGLDRDSGGELMLRDAAVALIQEQLGFRSDLSTNIITNMQAAQELLERGPTKPWFLITEDSYATTTVDEQRLPLPDDFLLEVEEAVLRYVPDEDDDDDSDTSNEVDLVKEDYDTLRKNYVDNVSGPPEAYAVMGGYFRLFPTPDDEYTIRMVYYAQDTALDTNIENQWLKYAPYVLMGATGYQMASAARDSNAMTIFKEWETKGRLTLFSENEARGHSNRSYQIGGPH